MYVRVPKHSTKKMQYRTTFYKVVARTEIAHLTPSADCVSKLHVSPPAINF